MFICRQSVNDVEPTTNWVQRQLSRLARRVRCRIARRAEGRTKPPDWFLDKFAAQTFTDPDEPLYQTKRSKILCGLKLAFDPTLPAHYHVCTHFYFFKYVFFTVAISKVWRQ